MLSIALNELVSHTGAQACYCKGLIEKGVNLANSPQNWSYTDKSGNVIHKQSNICFEVYNDVISSFSITQLWSTGWSYMVVVNAYILRVILIMVAKTLRFKNLTEEIKWVTIAIFWMYMFNYGFVYIFGPWDSRDSEIRII